MTTRSGSALPGFPDGRCSASALLAFKLIVLVSTSSDFRFASGFVLVQMKYLETCAAPAAPTVVDDAAAVMRNVPDVLVGVKVAPIICWLLDACSLKKVACRVMTSVWRNALSTSEAASRSDGVADNISACLTVQPADAD